jgi:hypothetical protein
MLAIMWNDPRAGIIAALLISLTVGCGSDDEGSAPPPPKTSEAPAPAAAAAAAGAKGVLKKYRHVEDLLSEEEQGTIRHKFQDRDFNADIDGENRDPFRSFVVVPVGLVGPVKPGVDEVTDLCSKKQLVASNYSIRDLKLTGIVSRGTKRFALMQDTANLGNIIARGDCVGREKARVKDIGAGYITFDIAPELGDTGAPRAVEERSVQLYPGDLPISTGGDSSDNAAPSGPATPAVMPDGAPDTDRTKRTPGSAASASPSKRR